MKSFHFGTWDGEMIGCEIGCLIFAHNEWPFFTVCKRRSFFFHFFQSCWFLSLLKFLFKLKWRQKRMLKPRHDLQTSYFESSRLLTYFPLTEFCWTQQQPSHCFWHKLPFLTMCEKSWHELSWHLTHLLRSSKNSVEIESARKRPLSTNSTSFWETTFNMLCHYTKCNRKISPTPCHFKSKSFSSTLRFWATFSVISSHFSKQWMSLKKLWLLLLSSRKKKECNCFVK